MATTKMNRNRLTVSFVGVFKGTLGMLPILDSAFCMQLFQQPQENIISGLTPEGFSIRVKNGPAPAVIINPQKIVFIATNNELLYSYIDAVKNEFAKINFNMSYSAYGLNYEYEWVNLNDESPNWLWKHFINSKLSIDEGCLTCHKLALKVDIDNDEYIYTEIEPRFGIKNGIFALINHHKQAEMDTLPSGEELIPLYETSSSMLDSKLFTTIIEKGK